MRSCFYRAFCLGFLLSSAPAFSESFWTFGVTEESGWSDFNKTGNGDINLCWAASASNLINWWQTNSAYASCANAGTPKGEAIFRTYASSFSDKRGDAAYAWEWWYKGTYMPYDLGLEEYGYPMPLVTDPASWGGGYYKAWMSQQDISYWGDMMMETESTPPEGGSFSAYCSRFIVSSLNSNYGVSLGIAANNTVGHAITLWGVETNDETGMLTKIYFTDSDDNRNELRSCGLKETNGYLYLDGYNPSVNYYIDFARGLNLLEAIPEPASSSLLLLSGSLLFLRRTRRSRS